MVVRNEEGIIEINPKNLYIIPSLVNETDHGEGKDPFSIRGDGSPYPNRNRLVLIFVKKFLGRGIPPKRTCCRSAGDTGTVIEKPLTEISLFLSGRPLVLISAYCPMDTPHSVSKSTYRRGW